LNETFADEKKTHPVLFKPGQIAIQFWILDTILPELFHKSKTFKQIFFV